MHRYVLFSLLFAGCATLSGAGTRGFTAADHEAFAECEFESRDDAHTWRCAGQRLVDGRLGVSGATLEDHLNVLARAHPNLSRPEFSKTDVNEFEGEPVRLTMLGYSDGLALAVVEQGGRGRSLTCAMPGAPASITSELVTWCKPRMSAVWRSL